LLGNTTVDAVRDCERDVSLLYLVLLLGTLWLGVTLYNFTKTYVQSTLDISNSDISNSATLEGFIWIKSTF